MTSLRHDIARALLPGSPAPRTARDVSFWRQARAEGVLPLAVHRLSGSSGIPPAILREARDSEARAVLDGRDLRAVLDEFARHGIRVLVIKGAALACTLYERPGLRPRIDSDLLIAKDDIGAVHALFRESGARYVPHVTGEYVMSQFHYVRTDLAGCEHAYDIHWRVVNPVPFATAFDFHGLWRRSVPLPDLAPAARGPSRVDALLIASAHRVAHHSADGRLLWLLDVHLLAESMAEEECRALVDRARACALTAVASHTLLEAASMFEGDHTSSMGSELGADAARMSEPTAAYLAPRTRLQEATGDLLAIPWHARIRLIRELAFPSSSYMRNVYAAGRGGFLPVLYARRLVSGLARWARPRGQ